MRLRFWATLAVAAIALIAPAASHAAVNPLWVDADGSQAASGPINSKTIFASIGGGSLIANAKFALPLAQFDPTAAGELLAAPSNPGCANPPDTQTADGAGSACLGYVAVFVGGVEYDLALDTGDCADIPAPAQDPTSDAYTAAHIIFTGSSLAPILAQVGSPACLGVAVDVYNGDGTVVLTVDLSPLAEQLPTVIISEADVTIWNVDLDGNGPNAQLFKPNPDANNITTVDDSVTITLCAVAVAGHHCDTTGASYTDTVRETLGGANSIGVADLAKKIAYGSTVHLTGTTYRGDSLSPHEIVDIVLLTPTSRQLDLTPASITGDIYGNFDFAWRAIASGIYGASSYLAGPPHSDTYHSTGSAAFEVYAPSPGLKLKKSHKKKSHHKTTYTVKITVTAASGLTEKIKVGSKTYTKLSHGTAIVITVKKVKKGTKVSVTSSATDVTSGAASKKV
jgi:hypothetical protein